MSSEQFDRPVARNNVQDLLRSAREASSNNVFDDSNGDSGRNRISRDGEVPEQQGDRSINTSDSQLPSYLPNIGDKHDDGTNNNKNNNNNNKFKVPSVATRAASKPVSHRPVATLGEMVRRHDFRGLDKFALPFVVESLDYQKNKDTASIAMAGNPNHKLVNNPTFSRNPGRPRLAGDRVIASNANNENDQTTTSAAVKPHQPRGYGFGASPTRETTGRNNNNNNNNGGATRQSAYFPVKGDFPQQPPADLSHLFPPSQDLARHLFSAVNRSGLASIGISQDSARMLWPGFCDSSIVDRAFDITLKKRGEENPDTSGAMRFDGFFPMLRCVAFMNNVAPLFKMMNRGSSSDNKISRNEFVAIAPQLRLKDPETEFEEIDDEGNGEISIDQLCSYIAENPTKYADLEVLPLMALQNAQSESQRKKKKSALGKLNKNHADELAASAGLEPVTPTVPSLQASVKRTKSQNNNNNDDENEKAPGKNNKKSNNKRALSEDQISARSAPPSTHNNVVAQPPAQERGHATPRHVRVAERRAQREAERLEKLRALADASDERLAELRRRKEADDKARAEELRKQALAAREANMALSKQLEEDERQRLAEEALELERRARERELNDQKRREAYAKGQSEREAMLQAQAEKLAAERAKAEEEAKARRDAAIQAKRDKEEEERQKAEQEKADAARKAADEKARKEKEAAARKKRSAEAAQARAEKEAEEKAAREEAAKKRVEEDRQKREQELAEKEQKEAKRKAEAERKKQLEADRKAKQAEDARIKAEEEAARKEKERADAEEKKKKDAEAAAQKKAEQDAAKKRKEEEDKAKEEEDAARNEQARREAEEKNKEEQAAASTKKAEQDAAAAKIQNAARGKQARNKLRDLKEDRANEEKAAAQRALDEEAEAQRTADEEAEAEKQRQQKEQEAAASAAKKKNEDAAATKIQNAARGRQARNKLGELKKERAKDEETAAQRAAEEEAEAQRKADEEEAAAAAAAKKKADDEAAAAAKKEAEEEAAAAAKKQEEEEAAAKKKADDEAAAKKKADEDAKKKAAAEKAIADAKAKKDAEEAEKKRKEEEAKRAAEEAAKAKEEARKQGIRDRFAKPRDNVASHHLIMDTEKKYFNDLSEFASDFRNTPETTGITEDEFKSKCVPLTFPGNKAGSCPDRAWTYATKNAHDRIEGGDELCVCLQFVVYANNLQPLFENVNHDGVGTLNREEFAACAEQFEIENSDKAFQDMISFINTHLGMNLSASTEDVPFDLYCYWLSRERPYFDVEVEVEDVAVPQGQAGSADASFTGTFEVARKKNPWKTRPPCDLDNLELPTETSLLQDLFDFLDPKETNFIDQAQFVQACAELWPGFKNVEAAKSAFQSVRLDANGNKISNKRFARALQYVVYANNLHSLFDATDKNGNKLVEREEFLAIAQQFKLEDAGSTFDKLDVEKHGFINFETFCEWVTTHKEQIENAGGQLEGSQPV